ncbi:MAG: T9SS type A sorting domain-containing protein [Candidatus Marinimicrobia bacterium]|nr:T9SS type A sorting domain-containing protein [Candidatus Neomarinimicrobiota bacterium]
MLLLGGGLHAQALAPLPIKCGFSLHGPQRLPALDLATFRPERQAFYSTPDGAFAIHYDTTGIDSVLPFSSNPAGVPDWVVEVGEAFSLARDTLLAWGYRGHLDDGDGVYDVYLGNEGGGVYGETQFEDLQPDGSYSTYIMMDNDFSTAENYWTYGLDAARVTAAHEYFHAVQLAYPYRAADLYLYEMSSTWYEERIFPEVNDWTYWMADFIRMPQPEFSSSDGYGATFFGHYLAGIYGVQVIKDTWERMPSDRAIDALRKAISTAGGDLATDWNAAVAGLLLNGRSPAGYYHPDQEFLPRPVLPDSILVTTSELLSASNLGIDKVLWLPLKLTQAATLRLAVSGATSLSYAASVVYGAGTDYRWEPVDNQFWENAGLDRFSEIVLAISGSPGSVEFLATVISDSGLAQFALQPVAPNPIRLGSGVAGLTIRYHSGEVLEAAEHRITLFNLLGQQVFTTRFERSIDISDYQFIIPQSDLTRMPSGIYFVRLSINGKHHLVGKFTVLD